MGIPVPLQIVTESVCNGCCATIASVIAIGFNCREKRCSWIVLCFVDINSLSRKCSCFVLCLVNIRAIVAGIFVVLYCASLTLAYCRRNVRALHCASSTMNQVYFLVGFIANTASLSTKPASFWDSPPTPQTPLLAFPWFPHRHSRVVLLLLSVLIILKLFYSPHCFTAPQSE